ncbi:hypothetical protein NBRC116589_12560 [Ruegeria sp. HU-ET01832]
MSSPLQLGKHKAGNGLPDEHFSALKLTVAAEAEKGLHRLIAALEEIASVQESDPPRTGDPADD